MPQPDFGLEFSSRSRFVVHAHPIGRDGNCAAALGHLSPNGLPDNAACNPQTPGRCQEGVGLLVSSVIFILDLDFLLCLHRISQGNMDCYLEMKESSRDSIQITRFGFNLREKAF